VAQKLIFVTDPGIDGAFTLAVALHDPSLSLLGVAATAGNVDAGQATLNVQTIIDQVDPPRWPRIGAALPVDYDIDGRLLHGPRGLGGTTFPCAQLHHQHQSDKLIIDLARQNPNEMTVVVAGPLTVLARAFDRDPELPSLLQRVVCVGGNWREIGDASLVSEFHFFCDPQAARHVINAPTPFTLIPLDVTRQIIMSPTRLQDLPCPESRACRFLRQIVPFGIGATANRLGIEGFHLEDLLGILYLAKPGAFTTRSVGLDVETRGELTRGMCVVDTRGGGKANPRTEMAVEVDTEQVWDYVGQVLKRAG
jgi:inosine-uridine nucleoside N-ribohydrolase